MGKVFDLVLFRAYYTSLICYVINFLAAAASRIVREVKCRPGEYYSAPAENCISCHIVCDNAVMKKSLNLCNTYCPDFVKSPEHIPEGITDSAHSDLSWVAGPVVGGVGLILVVTVLVIYYQKHSRFVKGKQFHGSRRQRNVTDLSHDEELQILDPQQGPQPPPGNPTTGSPILEGRHQVALHCLPENPHNPLELNNVPHSHKDVSISQHNPASDHQSRQDSSHYLHHPNQSFPSASQPFCSSPPVKCDQLIDSSRGPIPYVPAADDRVLEEESDTIVMKLIGESQAAQNGMKLEVLSSEPQSFQNDNRDNTQPHSSMVEYSTGRRGIEVQESLVRAEVSRSIPQSSNPNTRSQVYYNRNIPSVNENYHYQPGVIDTTSNAFHAAVMEHNVQVYVAIPHPTSISIPVIVEHPEGDPDNLEWQEQQHRAAEDKRCLHHPGLGINQYEEKEFSVDIQKALIPSI